MPLLPIEKTLVVAAYFRGMTQEDSVWISNSDQIVTLSLFYTGDISSEECLNRFSCRSYIGRLYQSDGKLNDAIATRYAILVELLQKYPELIQGGGNWQTPADPTYTSCRLTVAGLEMACELIPMLPAKPEFPNWPDKRTFPSSPV